MSLLNPRKPPNLAQVAYAVGHEYTHEFVKAADSKPTLSYGLAGRLIVSASGWGLLTVPNALVRGAFDALDEPGVELPPSGSDEGLSAHISVFRKKDIDEIGGPSKLTERGHSFRYTLGQVKVVSPAGWDEISKAWLIEVHSPELEKLRKSYNLSALPNDGKYKFHITIGVRRKNVLRDSGVSKAD
jgi:hypothetical protein